jgi:hypothetical protein
MLDTPSSEVVKGTGYPLHSPVSPSLPLPYVTMCHQISTGIYLISITNRIQLRVLRRAILLILLLKETCKETLLNNYGRNGN